MTSRHLDQDHVFPIPSFVRHGGFNGDCRPTAFAILAETLATWVDDLVFDDANVLCYIAEAQLGRPI